MRIRSIVLSLLASALGACQCDDAGLVVAHGAIFVEKAVVDFGEVGVGGRGSRELVIENRGVGPLRITAIDRAEGFPPEFGLSPDTLSVSASADGKVTFFFDPVSEGAREGKVIVRSDTPDKPELEVTVKGLGVSTEISADPLVLDFGKVVKGSQKRLTFDVVNTGLKATTATVASVGGDHPGLFTLEAPQAGIALEGGQRFAVGVVFKPTFAGAASAVVLMRACSNCPDVPVSLRGEGIVANVHGYPNPLDFGWVELGGEGALELNIENLGASSTSYRLAVGAQPGYPAEFRLPDVTPDTVYPLAGKQKIENPGILVTFEPTVPGDHRGVIVIDSPGSGRVLIETIGYSGGPEIDVRPAALTYGPVGQGYAVTKSLTIFNLAWDDPSTRDNLVLSAIAASDPEYQVRLPATVTLPVTLLPGRSLKVDVTYRPADLGDDPGELTVNSNDPDERVTRIPLSASGTAVQPCVYTVTPDPDPGLVFGVVPAGTTVKQRVTLRNTGSNSCTLNKLSFVGAGGAPPDPAFAMVQYPTPPTNVNIAAGGQLEVDVAFTAGQNREHSDVLQVDMNASTLSIANVKLSGTSRQGCLSINPQTFDFGVVQPGCASNAAQFRVTNNCSVAVRLDQLTVTGQPQFQTVSAPPSGYTLSSGQQTTFTIRYVPTGSGLDTGYATLFSSAGAPIGISLQGEGSTGATYTETFTQVSAPKVDIVWIVDNSGSMGEEQTNIANNASAFMSFLTGRDYQMAVTTTDVIRGGGGWSGDSTGEDGRFVGNPQIITPTTAPSPTAVFQANINRGTNGDWVEMGLEATYRALYTREGEHPSFLRPDANLAIILLSDEEDSVHLSRTVDWYYAQFVAKKGGDASKLVFSGITGGGSGCSTASPESRYTRMIQLTAGVWESICTPNWAQSLQNIGQTSSGVKTSFPLGRPAEPGTVSVTVNGVAPAAADWRYDAVSNAVIFTNPPATGAEIKVTFKERC